MTYTWLKRFGCVSGFLALGLILGACSNDTNQTTTTEPALSGSNEVATQDNEVEAQELRIVWRDLGENDNLRRFFENYFVESFEAANPDIRLVLAPIMASEADYFGRVALSMQSPDTAPDIVAQDSFQLNADASAGFLLPLDNRVHAWDEWDYYIENIKQGYVAQSGRLYAIPGTSDSRGLWVNLSVLEEAGLPANWSPTTWEEILEGARAIRDNTDAIPLGFNVARSAGEAVTMQTFLMFLEGTDDSLFDQASGQFVARSQGFLDSLRFIDTVFNQENLSPSLSMAMGTNYASLMFQELLPTGQAGIALDGFWNVNNWLEGGAHPLDNPEEIMAFLPMPTQFGQGAGSVTMSGGWGWAIPYNSQNHDLAWRVLQAMGSAENQAIRATLEGNLTVREDSATNPRYTAVPFMEIATGFLANSQFRPAREEYPQISVEIQTAVEAVASGSSTPEQAMDEFERNVLRIVGEGNAVIRETN